MKMEKGRNVKEWIKSLSFTSFRTRMTILFLVIALVPMLFSTIFSSYYLKSVVKDEVHSKEESILKANVTAIDYSIERQIAILKEMMKYEEIKSGNEKEIVKILLKFEQANKDVEQYVYVNKDEIALTSAGQKIPVSDRDYIKQAKETKKPVSTDLIVSKSTGNNIVVLFVPMLDDKQNFIGGMFTPLSTGNLNVYTNTIQIGATGYGYLMSPSGGLLTYPGKEHAGKNIADVLPKSEVAKLQETVLKEKSGTFSFKGDDGIARGISFDTIPSTGWRLVTNMVDSEVYGAVETAKEVSIWLAVITTIVVAAIALLVSTATTKPILAITEAVKKMAQGDLTPRLTIKRSDELGQLGTNMNQMLDSFSEIVGKASLTAEQLGASSEELTAAATESVGISNRIVESMQEVFNASEGQLMGAEQTSIAMGEMAVGVQRIAESSAVVTEASHTSMMEVQQGSIAIHQAVEQMKFINDSVGKSAEDMRVLEAYSQKIGEIVSVITEIANQTQLLSLNASIEAARAGEQGRGFAVVANEVKKLAEQSSSSAKDISELIREVQSSTTRAVQAMNSGVKDVEKGSELIDEAGQVFNRVTVAFQEISDQIQEVSAASQEMSAGTEEVSASMSEIVSMTKASHEHGQGISQGSEKQLAAMEEISASAEDLSHMAQELQESLSRFKTR
ncbi:methyl-accepting chemotaxis protein [Paenibacillus qinlingensis]|uniref:Methyl-accepting chemotaxis protein n=1 Tax=Paenibacillus qinlingensis TaxID=1837343 RepID=A0ABU1P3Q3_9BACL|nr:methyl-accepting chemotaxis protein [Paenibacillus qinlingensis]MDR6554379.1 methyl-accepting chemotaxis protein [Paenibacillus qinlingensis]